MNAYQTLCNMLHEGKITKPTRTWSFGCEIWVPKFGWIIGNGDSIDAAQCSALKAYRKHFGDV